MKYILPILLFALIISSCRKPNDISGDTEARLSFSTDTILFDTVFTEIGSTTKRFKIYNFNKKTVEISSIRVGTGSQSSFRVNIDGISNTQVTNYRLAAGDSAFVFAEVTIDPNNDAVPFIVSDSIIFETNGNIQDVNLVAFGQNAHFYADSVLPCDIFWTNDLPYVIYNSVLVQKGCKLNIGNGVKIYNHKGSKIFVQGTLRVFGSKSDSVIFQTDRREEFLDDEPGQWGGIHFLRGSVDNRINFAVIKNAIVGVRVDSLAESGSEFNVEIINTTLKYHTVAGVLGFTGGIRVMNSLFFACNQFAFIGLLGGKYHFFHNTIGNYNNVLSRNQPSVAISDNFDTGEELLIADVDATFVNNIIYGPLKTEFVLNNDGGATLNLAFETNIIRTEDTALFSGSNNILNLDPKFIDIGEENFRIDTLSPAFMAGTDVRLISGFLNRDKDNVDRPEIPTIGCFERVE